MVFMKNLKKIFVIFCLFVAIGLLGCVDNAPWWEIPDAVNAFCDEVNNSYGQPNAQVCIDKQNVLLSDLAQIKGIEKPENSSAGKISCSPTMFLWFQTGWTLNVDEVNECKLPDFDGCKLDSDGINAYCYNSGLGDAGRPLPAEEAPPEM